jgi:hypothetical protein
VEVQENADAEASFALASLVLEYEELIPMNKRKREWYPTWIQVLRKDRERDGESAGHTSYGRIKAIQESLETRFSELHDENSALKDQLNTLACTLRDQQQVILEKVVMLEKVAQQQVIPENVDQQQVILESK